jgi:hypothetical protein
MRMRLLFSAAVIVFVISGASAKADDTYACTVFLCTAPGAGDWRGIPACVGPVTTAMVEASVGIPWPICPEAAISTAASQANANSAQSQ